jgi:pimeloyl-ACP methyl ester carboxylesterase
MTAAANEIRRRPRLGMATVTVFLVLLVAGLAVALLARHEGFSSSTQVLHGSGIAVIQTREVASFSAVDLAGSNNVTIRAGAKQSVVVHGDDNLIRYVTTRVAAGTLVIRDTRNYATNAAMTVKVTVPSLRMLRLIGSGTASATHIRSSQLTVELAGSGIVRASGSATKLSVTLGGSGEAQLLGLAARDVRAAIAGSGEIRVTATRTLDASIPGSGEILYGGDPEHVLRSVTGSGAITQTVVSGRTRRAAAPTLKSCVVQGVNARCGTIVVPENRAEPNGRKVGLHVVVLPALIKPAAKDAVTYLAGGPGAGATSDVAIRSQQLSGLNRRHDIVLVDQRGTGESNPYSCPNPKKPLISKADLRDFTRACLKAFGGDMRQYGTRMAMDDLDAVRAALGYRQLDVIGSSYGATAAQVYMNLHPSSVRTLILVVPTALDVPFFGHYAVNAQRALDQWARLCASQSTCRKAFPGWERTFGKLVEAWDAHPVQIRKGATMTGVQLAAVIHRLLLDLDGAPSIPLVVSRAAKGDYAPLIKAGRGDLSVSGQLMYWSIWCNEPWAGLDAQPPWGTAFDTYTAAFIGQIRQGCTFMPKRAEPRSLWTFPSSKRAPVLVFAGGADPQDPISNLPNLQRNFPDSRAVILPHIGHNFGLGGCVDSIMTNFVARNTTKGLLTTQCDSQIVVPPFKLTD